MLWANFVFANCIGFIIHGSSRSAIGSPGDAAASGHSGGLLFRRADRRRRRRLLARVRDPRTEGARARMFTPRGSPASSRCRSSSRASSASSSSRARGRREGEAAFEPERARVATAERAAALASLKALEAQVEPHFLYNTLAHVESLIDREPATAKRMLARLIVLLRAAAAGGRDNRSTLGGAARAHARLPRRARDAARAAARWSVDASAALAARALPPCLLQPLVENAIKHGIEPELDGGNVFVVARAGRAAGDRRRRHRRGLRRRAAPVGGSTGIGLANLRARLAALYGGEARMTIAENAPRGVRVTMRLRSTTAAPTVAAGERDARPTAIVADDEPRLAEALVERLRRAWPELDHRRRRRERSRGARAHRRRIAGRRVPRHPDARASPASRSRARRAATSTSCS